MDQLRLRLEVHAGTLVLDAMIEALAREDWLGGLALGAQLDPVIARMRKEKGEAFQRSAEALLLRGRELAGMATRVVEIVARFGTLLHVQAVIQADPLGREPDSAIVSGVLMRDGDNVIDPATDELIEGLRVVEIEPGRVRFRFEDACFYRALGAAAR